MPNQVGVDGGGDLPPDIARKVPDAADRLCPVLQTLAKAAPVKMECVLGYRALK